MKLQDKVCIITGASRGIGKAMAIGFAREGADIVIAARSEVVKDERLPGTIHETAEEVRALGRRALPVKTDVTKEEQIEEMVSKTIEEFGKVDVMVHNAALAFWKNVKDTPTKIWDLVMNVNLRGAFFCARAVLPHMIKQGSGSIINISSIGADIGGDIRSGMAYSSAKAGVERLSNGLAEEVREYGIAVNGLKPARGVNTEGMRYWTQDIDPSQWATTDNMVAAAIFLAAQGADGVTGRIFTDEGAVEEFGLTYP